VIGGGVDGSRTRCAFDAVDGEGVQDTCIATGVYEMMVSKHVCKLQYGDNQR
jgi:hypothetical protein